MKFGQGGTDHFQGPIRTQAVNLHNCNLLHIQPQMWLRHSGDVLCRSTSSQTHRQSCFFSARKLSSRPFKRSYYARAPTSTLRLDSLRSGLWSLWWRRAVISSFSISRKQVKATVGIALKSNWCHFKWSHVIELEKSVLLEIIAL